MALDKLTSILEDKETLSSLDPSDVYGSTGMLADQCRQIWADAQKIEFPKYEKIDNVLFCGMGGSAYGGYIARALYKEKLSTPIISNNDYHLPGFAGKNTLVILASYSGSTEEVLSCAGEALERGCKITALTGGGKLGELLKSNNLPALVFNDQYNPSNQPRLGTGYMVLGALAILARFGLLQLKDGEVEQAIRELEQTQEEIKNRAKDIAEKLEGFIPVTFAAEFLEGNIHIIRNQLNETSKSFAAFFPLPELNHHLMEGLKNPTDKKLAVLFIDSERYSVRIQERVAITKEVVKKNHVSYLEYKAGGNSPLSQILNVLSFGGFVSLYMAFLYHQNPGIVPWVDYFKAQLR